MDGDSLGIVHSRAERYVRNLESAPDRWHFDNETIYLIYGDRIDSVPFANNVAGETRVWASEDDEDVMALSAFLNINDTDRMPLEEDNINSQYRVAISLVPDYLIYEDQPRALQDVTQFMIHLAQNGYDPTTITAQFDVEHNEIDLLGISDFDYHQMVMLHEDLNRIMDDAPLNGYIYAIFTAPGIAEDFYPMTYGYPAARQAMMARSFLAEDHVFASTVRIEKTSGIIERIVAMQKALEASQLQERMIRVQYGIKHGLITSPEQAIATLAGVDDVRGAETDRKTDFKTHIKVGDTVRSYDFPFGSDTSCYVEGVVVRIAPAPSGICPCGLDHYHIVTQRRVFNDKETSDFAEAYFPVADPAQTRLEVVESKDAESTDSCPLCQSPPEEWEDSFVCGECDRTICSGCDTSDEDPICPECQALDSWDLPLPDSLKASRFDEGTWFLDEAYKIFPWEVLDNSEHGFWESANRGKLIRNLDWRDLIDGERGDDEQIDLRAIIRVDWPGDLNGSETFTSTTDPDRKINLELDYPPFGDYNPTPVLVRVKKGGYREKHYLNRGYPPFGSDQPVFEVLDRHRTPGDTDYCLYISVNGEIFRCGATLDDDDYIIYEAPRGRPKGSGAGNYACGRCGKSGHNARTCDQPTPPKPLKPPSQSGVMRPSKSQQENLPSYRCSNCGVRGHNKGRCPEPAKIEVVDPRIIDDFEKWQSGESKLQAAGRIKRNILRILTDEPSGLGREQFIERYHLNTGTQSKQRKEVSKLTRTANKMTSDVILWRDRYYALGDGGKEAFFKTGPGSLRTDIVSQPPRSDQKCGNCGETGHHRNQCDKSENIWVPAPKPKLRAEE